MSTLTETIQAQAREITGTLLKLEGDLHAFFTVQGIASGQFNERALGYVRNLNADVSTAAAAWNYILQNGVAELVLTPPVATWVSDDSTYDPVFSLTEITENDVVEVEIDDNSDFSSLFDSDTNTIDSAEALAGSISFTGISTLSGGTTYYARFRYKRNDVWSDYSNTVSQTMAGSSTAGQPIGFGFGFLLTKAA